MNRPTEQQIAARPEVAPPARFREYFGDINFSSVNEDWRTEARALAIEEGDTVLCVTGSGDRPLDLLAQCDPGALPETIVAVDLDRAQSELLKLKIAALVELEYDAYARFLGLREATGPDRLELFDTVARRLDPESVEFWSAHRAELADGVLYVGRFEQYFTKVSRLAHLIRGRLIEQLFEFDDLDAQRRFVDERWDRWWWRGVFRVLLHPAVSRLFYGDPAYFAHVGVRVGDYLYETMTRFLRSHLARDSFMLSLLFRGRLSEYDLPPYLTREGHATLRDRVERIEVVTDDVIEHMAALPVATYSRFSLSDVPSYLSQFDFMRLLNAVQRTAKPGARVVIRQFLTEYDLPAHLRNRFVRDPALEEQLAVDDHAFAYRFIVATYDPMGEPSGGGITIREYTPEDDEAALELERRSPQGESYRLSFRRKTFHRRSENFDEYRIVVAEADGRLVGTSAVALKDATVFGEPHRVAFFYDARVDPDYRGRGIARRMGNDTFRWAFERVDWAYLYTVADNRVVRYLMALGNSQDVGGYTYLVYPTYRQLEPIRAAREATLDEVHRSMIRHAGPFDFYSDPRNGPTDPWVGSWLVEDGDDVAGCSAWDNRDILAEVVERIPWTLRLVRLLSRLPGLRGRLPHIPAAGEELASWYLFDFHATDPVLAKDLMRRVVREAAAHGIDYCYIPYQPDDGWVAALREEVPDAFVPRIPYRMLAGSLLGKVPPMQRIYVDVRDL